MATDAQKPRLEREFQAAVAQYESGHFPEAAQRLESLVREVPESFEVHELTGAGLFGAVTGCQGQRYIWRRLFA